MRLNPKETEIVQLSRRMATLIGGEAIEELEEKEEIVTLAFPPEGDVQAIPTGTTIINFYNKDIVYGDKSTSMLERGLQNSPGNHREMHSLYMHADQKCKIKLVKKDGDTTSWMSVYTDMALDLREIDYEKLMIYTDIANAGVSIIASTNPKAAVNVHMGVTGSLETKTYIETDETLHFTGALAQDVQENENIAGLAGHIITINGISVTSVQALHYAFYFYSTNAFDYSHFIGMVDVDLASFATQIGTRYYLDLSSVALEYEDDSAAGQLHIALLNLDGNAKNAGATGYIQARVKYTLGR